jgi:tRNA(Arg) A34 adenosine deaminase TadA
MKTDQYLNLCLGQAALSTLHYRHGCVVVKGGKVIGQGFNDCRPGYDGGSVLKTGVLPKSAANVKLDNPGLHKRTGNFRAVERIVGNCGGGYHANAQLTLHSEMMAINSALSSCSTMAASTVARFKPSFRLLGDSKRKRALRRDAVLAYTRSVCLATFGPQVQQGAGPAQAGESCVRPATCRCDDLPSHIEQARLSPSSLSPFESVSEREGVQEQQAQEVQV